MTTVLETCGIAPPPGAAAELTVPLCFFDIVWLHFHPIDQLIFYDHPCSEEEFSKTVVPNLKHSLSLTLKHYLPVAANLLYPHHIDKSQPVIRYVSGDTVPLTVAISGRNFDDLVGSHARESDQFYDFLPPMPPLTEQENYKIAPLVALQVTLFSDRGFCIGLSNNHCLGDARSVVGFMSTWAEINKCGGDKNFMLRNAESLPLIFDRSVFGDISGITDKCWNMMRNIPLAPSSPLLPTNRVRAAFTLHQSDIKKLKNIALSKNPDIVCISSFVVTAAYTWSCMVKSAAAADENDPEVPIYSDDGRGRSNALVEPPVPINYFGNCLGGGPVKLERNKVAADSGFVEAAEAIADHIMNNVNNKENFLKNLDNWLSKSSKLVVMSALRVSGSPKFDLSDADFGWGKGRRLEVLSMDKEKYSMSLCKSSDSDGGLVVGMSLPRERMEVFTALFEDGLKLIE
ncbi:malonyl-coenzyme:anthocyanin 5-O-glucoside-6'''-O-malonyltransferase-like [Salvia miltiorrhiza]|uniref:malonyl-coenzyme:anthocyanin 5-O-glucoside-6'''-O-malonyltransferase-like n=1 Tax=Salvia miltiorrhiza TaxID=226208 RepID=UPI0025AD081E|nr:malonyl-coenzyme:anthocyanin 5-O-glucoside-6'''-O-malonyltransferase-like [Salvia miltiorrhiza]